MERGCVWGCILETINTIWSLVKKAERQRIDAFELWFWRRLLKVPWTARANQSILREIKPVSLKGDQPWTFTEKTDAEAPVFWSSDVNRQLFGRVPDAGKDPGRKEKRPSEDERAGWHHWCSEHELGQTPGDGEGQGGPACCSPWGRTELDTTGRLNNNSSSNAQWTLRYCIAVLVAVVLVYKFVWWRKKRFGQ